MSKTAHRFYADPTKDPSFESVQREWYLKLELEEFRDIEDPSYPERPLKQWSGVSSERIELTQPENSPIISSFTETIYYTASHFVHHPEFGVISSLLRKHGNSCLTSTLIETIWGRYCDGRSEREIARETGINDSTIHRTIQRIIEWMIFMDDEKTEAPQPEESSTVVLRSFVSDIDSPFLYASWRNALWFEEKRDDRFSEEFYKSATREIKKLLTQPDARVRIACLQEDPDFIVGYSVITGKNLEWVYVKGGYRRKGIGKLLSKGFLTISKPCTRVGLDIAKNHCLKENAHGREERSYHREETPRAEAEV